MTEYFDDPRAAAEWCARERALGRSLGLVPTMGALHAGHLSLARRAATDCDRTCASVFVNPLQFDDPRDLERYPRDLARDLRQLASSGCDMAFSGTLESFFPGELDAAGALPAARLIDPGPASRGLEGQHRKGHFEGVATIVDRLFELTVADRAYFGAKDFQQSLVVEHVARRRGAPRIVRCATVRATSGLALSSRNRLLSPDSIDAALSLSRGLRAARDAWRAGERDAAGLRGALRAPLERDDVDLEYAELRVAARWEQGAPEGTLESAVALVAARVAGVRLIDNTVLEGDDPLGTEPR